jgi:hypothetical protein
MLGQFETYFSRSVKLAILIVELNEPACGLGVIGSCLPNLLVDLGGLQPKPRGDEPACP